MASIPTELKYTASHEWVYEEDGVFTIGITDFAQEQLGDLVFVNLPQVGDTISAGEAFGDVESVKAVSDIYSPVTGTVCEINEDLLDSPELINEEPYAAWFIRVDQVEDTEELLDAESYSALCENEA